MAAAASVGFLSGVVWAWLGGTIGLDTRPVVATVAVLGIGVGLLELIRGRVWLPQIDRETPRSWESRGPLFWALSNGAAMGSGVLTRISYSVWYVAPVGALFLGDMSIGGVAMAVYGAARGLGILTISFMLEKDGQESVRRRRRSWRVRAGRISAVGMIVASCAIATLTIGGGLHP